MFSAPNTGRLLFIIIALAIVITTLFLSNYISARITTEETRRVEMWAEALRESADPQAAPTNLSTKMLTEGNIGIPIILTNEADSIIDQFNVDTSGMGSHSGRSVRLLNKFRKFHQPIEWVNPADSTQRNKIYFGESRLSTLIKYLPIAQLLIVALFVWVVFYAIQVRNKSTQNQVWAGMAKEAAHQLGTPITSLQGWVEILKEDESTGKMAGEISKDVDRLKLVSERFGKIGSSPNLEPTDILINIREMVDYIRKRAPGKINFRLHTHGHEQLMARISPPLFDWVIENLLKNALDAMNEKGTITIDAMQENERVIIDVTDTGKGMTGQHAANVFKPGFTTKKRGWGLGLTLSRRIVEEFHGGKIFMKLSAPGVGTTFRVELKKIS